MADVTIQQSSTLKAVPVDTDQFELQETSNGDTRRTTRGGIRATNAETKTAYEANSDTNPFTDAEQTKLSGVETSATADQTDAEIKTAYENNANTNEYDDAEQTKLAGIETAATADQTAAEIKTAYESNANTNEYDDAEQTKLAGIEALADVTDEVNVTASFPISDATALVKDPVDGTKRVRIDVGAITTATTRVMTMPDANVILANIALNTTHRTSDGSNHGFIDQSVVSGASPVFVVTNMTGSAAGIDSNATAHAAASGASHTFLDQSVISGAAPTFTGTNLTGIPTAGLLNDAVTYAKIQNVSATNKILGRITAGAGDTEELTAANVLTIIGVEAGATADQTAAEIKTAYESNANTNEYDDAEQTKLTNIEALADVTDTTNVNAAGAVMETDYNAQTLLIAVANDTPLPITVLASNFVGRKATGNVGVMTVTESLTVLGVEAGATADQTAAEIKTSYESNANTNEYDDAEQTKLSNIEALADVTDETNVTASFPISDATTLVKDPVDATKLMRIDVGAIATATTRVLTMPDADVTLADVALNTTHRTSDGSNHTFLDQSVISGSTPTLTGTNFTGIPTAGLVNNAVTLAKMAQMATDSFIGRDTAATGDPEILSATTARTILNVENASTADQTDVEIKTAYQNEVPLITQAAAEAGTATIIESFSALRVKQAIDALAPAGQNEYADDLFRVTDNADATKKMAFEVSAILTATTRTITMPDANVTLADIAINTTHRTSDGSDHTFLDQSVISGSTPTFTGTNITGIPTAGLNDEAITLAKMQHINQNEILGRITAVAGDVEALTAANVRTIINVENASSADQTDAEIETAYNNQVAIVPQAEAEAGTATTRRGWTAERVKQAIDALAPAGQNEYADNLFRITDDIDNTKKIAFEASAIVTATTRTITMPDANVTLADIATNTTHRSSDGSDHTFIDQSVISGATPTLTGTNFTGIPTAGINDEAITLAKLQHITTDRLLGRDTALTGDPEEITVGGGLEFTGSGGIQRSALTGDVTASAGSNATTIANSVVTYAKIQDVSVTDRLLGRDTAGAGVIEEIAPSAVRTMLGLVIGTDVQAWSSVLDATTASFLTADETKLDGIETAADVTDAVNVGAVVNGKQTIPVAATSMVPAVTDGCSDLVTTETTAIRPDLHTLEFRGDTGKEYAQFEIAMPKSWDEGTVTYRVFWTGLAAGAGDVSWWLQAVSVANDGTMDVAYGTAIELVDTFLLAEDLHITAESAAVTVASAAADTLTMFQLYRDPLDASDTRTVDSGVLSLQIFYTTDALNDA